MDLPRADELKAVLAVAREAGVLRLKAGSLEVEFAPPMPPSGADLVAAINSGAPLPPDPLDAVRASAFPHAPAPAERPDLMEALASGARLVEVTHPDPTVPQ